jgi:hypothetical protein
MGLFFFSLASLHSQRLCVLNGVRMYASIHFNAETQRTQRLLRVASCKVPTSKT